MLRNKKCYRPKSVQKFRNMENNTIENNQEDRVEDNSRLEIDYNESCSASNHEVEYSVDEIERNVEVNNTGNQNKYAESMTDNPILTMLLTEIRAQNIKFSTPE